MFFILIGRSCNFITSSYVDMCTFYSTERCLKKFLEMQRLYFFLPSILIPSGRLVIHLCPWRDYFFKFVTCRCKTMKGSTCVNHEHIILLYLHVWTQPRKGEDLTCIRKQFNMGYVILFIPSVHRLGIILK